MAEIVNFIWSWLVRGFNLAVNAIKHIWAETKAIFKMSMDVLALTMKNFQAYCSYSRERTWREENGTAVESGKDRLNVCVGISGEKSRPQGPVLPSEHKEDMKKLKEGCTESRGICGKMMEFIDEVEKIANDDEEHNNQQITGEKLRQLNQKRETQELVKMLERSLTVNPSLA